VGGACLLWVAAVRLTGWFGARSEIAKFERRSAAERAPAPAPVPAAPLPALPPAESVEAPPAPPLVAPTTNDFRLWSPERIKEYRASIAERSDGPLALLRIPNLDIEAAVLPDSTDWALNRGLGWIEGTARPGEGGNCGVAGHRDGFFRGLKTSPRETRSSSSCPAASSSIASPRSPSSNRTTSPSSTRRRSRA
jgi:hypothetical protein